MKILIVDDNEFSVGLITNTIGDKSIEIVTAKDGQQAIDTFQASAEGEFSLILMDIIMEDVTGDQAAMAIREMDRSDASQVKIYAITAMVSFAEEYQKYGFDGIITKPYTREDINKAIQSCEA